MSGYKWQTRFRLSPLNGVDETLDLNVLMSDASGPVLVELNYPPDIEERIDVNRDVRNRYHGIRPEITMTFHVGTIADQLHLAKIENALLRDDFDVFLSLDGGTTERLVEMMGNDGPRPLAGKTIAGAELKLSVVAKEILTTRPDMDASGSIRW